MKMDDARMNQSKNKTKLGIFGEGNYLFDLKKGIVAGPAMFSDPNP